MVANSKGRYINNVDVFHIIRDFGRRLEELLDNCSSDSKEINLRILLSALDPGKGSSRPPVFNDIKIFAEGTAPGLAKSFLITKDFIGFVNNEYVGAIFYSDTILSYLVDSVWQLC